MIFQNVRPRLSARRFGTLRSGPGRLPRSRIHAQLEKSMIRHTLATVGRRTSSGLWRLFAELKLSEGENVPNKAKWKGPVRKKACLPRPPPPLCPQCSSTLPEMPVMSLLCMAVFVAAGFELARVEYSLRVQKGYVTRDHLCSVRRWLCLRQLHQLVWVH